MFNQFDGFNVFSGHIRQRFHLLSLSQSGKAISAGHLVRVGLVKRSVSKVCNRSLKSSVICIQRPQNAHTVRKKCVPT